jgi:Tfp pilus assembly protein PilV
MRRAGMTLVEVIVAMLLLVSVVLVLGGFMTKFTQATGQAHLIVQANELAATRLDALKQQPSYTSIDTLAHTDSVKSDFSWYSVKTQIVHIGGGVLDSVDYKMVTVTVTHPQMKKIVTKTTAVAAF